MWRKLRITVMTGVGLFILISLVRWGGTARPGPLFLMGVALLLSLVSVFGLIFWWLYFSPLPPGNDRVLRPTKTVQPRLIGLLTTLSGFLFVAGGFWDEIWHRRYGFSGNDFFWPPHIMIYGSIALILLFAAVGLARVLRGSGNLRARFRSEPLMGLLALVAAYMLASLPSDQLWHQIYGPDITAWSLPHIIIGSGVLLVMISAAAIQLSHVAYRPWRRLQGLQGPELIALTLISWATVVLLQIGTSEWESISAIRDRGNAGNVFADAFWTRPEWLYPVVVMSIALFIGMLALHAFRRAGVTTTIALIVLIFRLVGLTTLHAGERMGFVSQLLILPPMLVLDLWYAARHQQVETLETTLVGTVLAALVFLGAGLPIISTILIYPRINTTTLPSMIGFGVLFALLAGWAGMRVGVWMRWYPRSFNQSPSVVHAEDIEVAQGVSA